MSKNESSEEHFMNEINLVVVNHDGVIVIETDDGKFQDLVITENHMSEDYRESCINHLINNHNLSELFAVSWVNERFVRYVTK